MSNILSAVFEASYPNGRVFQSLCKMLVSFNERPALTVAKSGLSCRTMDVSHVSMLDITVPAQAFTEWNVERESKFAVDLAKLLKRFPKPTLATAIRLNATPSMFRVKFRGRVSKSLTMATLDDWTDEQVPIPKIDDQFTANITLPAYDWANAVDDLSRGNDTCKLKAIQSTRTLTMLNDSTETQEELELTELQDFNVKDPIVQAQYSLNYLYQQGRHISLIHRALKTKNPTVRLGYAKNWPLQISTELPDRTNIQMYFAPRIDNEV